MKLAFTRVIKLCICRRENADDQNATDSDMSDRKSAAQAAIWRPAKDLNDVLRTLQQEGLQHNRELRTGYPISGQNTNGSSVCSVPIQNNRQSGDDILAVWCEYRK